VRVHEDVRVRGQVFKEASMRILGWNAGREAGDQSRAR
jgi:hypothetical protein